MSIPLKRVAWYFSFLASKYISTKKRETDGSALIFWSGHRNLTIIMRRTFPLLVRRLNAWKTENQFDSLKIFQKLIFKKGCSTAFLWLDTIKYHVFSETFIEIEDIKISFFNFNYFRQCLDFLTFPSYKKTKKN